MLCRTKSKFPAKPSHWKTFWARKPQTNNGHGCDISRRHKTQFDTRNTSPAISHRERPDSPRESSGNPKPYASRRRPSLLRWCRPLLYRRFRPRRRLCPSYCRLRHAFVGSFCLLCNCRVEQIDTKKRTHGLMPCGSWADRGLPQIPSIRYRHLQVFRYKS